jgi:hypothetical protein
MVSANCQEMPESSDAGEVKFPYLFSRASLDESQFCERFQPSAQRTRIECQVD